MSGVTMETNPPDLVKRMERYPDKLDTELHKAHTAALVVLHKGIPGYPSPPPNSTYIRTGSLARGLGSTMGGGASGVPSIYKTDKLGSGAFESAIGSTNPEYNAIVIDEQGQAAVHAGRWWTNKEWLEQNMGGITQSFEDASIVMADFLDGKG